MKDQLVTQMLARLLVLAVVPVLALPVAAQEEGEMPPEAAAMMEAWKEAGTPGEAHEHLAEGVGTYKVTATSWMDPEGEPMVSEGTATREAIFDGRYIEETFEGSYMGQPFTGRGLLGYDNVTERYWSTWVDSVSTGVLISYGSYDEEAGEWRFEGEYPDPISGDLKAMKMVGQVEEDREVWEFWEERDGELVKTTKMVYEPQ